MLTLFYSLLSTPTTMGPSHKHLRPVWGWGMMAETSTSLFVICYPWWTLTTLSLMVRAVNTHSTNSNIFDSNNSLVPRPLLLIHQYHRQGLLSIPLFQPNNIWWREQDTIVYPDHAGA